VPKGKAKPKAKAAVLSTPEAILTKPVAAGSAVGKGKGKGGAVVAAAGKGKGKGGKGKEREAAAPAKVASVPRRGIPLTNLRRLHRAGGIYHVRQSGEDGTLATANALVEHIKKPLLKVLRALLAIIDHRKHVSALRMRHAITTALGVKYAPDDLHLLLLESDTPAKKASGKKGEGAAAKADKGKKVAKA
jgi:hypothetical protein